MKLPAGCLVSLVLFAWAPIAEAASPIARPTQIHVIDNARRIDVNRLNMWSTNYGSFAWNLGGQGAPPGLIFPRGTNKTAVFASGIWLGCKVNGEVRTVVAEYSQEFGPGIMVGGTYDDPGRPEYVVYKVIRFTGNPDDTAHVDRARAELAADPNLDPLHHHSWSEYMAGAVPHGAPWRFYRFPTGSPGDSIDVPGPDVSGDQMLWAVYNDADPGNHTNEAGGSTPLGVEIQQSTFAFNQPGPLGNTVFVRFKIINKGTNVLDGMYVSVWSDPDLGGATDDLVGSDIGREMGYCYNATNADALYGATPPAIGYDLLRGPIPPEGGGPLGLTSFNKYINGTDPASTSETYNYMQGLLPDGNPVIDPTTNSVTTYFNPGDPLTGTGWLDSLAADRRMLISSGPISMAPGDTQEVVVAIVIGEGQGNLDSIAELRCSDDYVQSVFDQGFAKPLPPVPAECPKVENCPRDLAFWSAQCPSGGSELTGDQLMIVATFVDQRSTFFDWTNINATQQFCNLVSAGAGDVRQQAKQQFATLLANFEAGRLAMVTQSGRPITLLPQTPISCSGLEALTVAELVATALLDEQLVDALYLNDNTANRRALEGIDAGLRHFNGGADVAFNFFGSSLDPTFSPDSFMTVELRFDHTTTQKAYRYLRLEQQDGSAPINGREYRYGGHHTVPFTCWDVESNQQLEVAFVERAVTDANGTILAPEFQVATFDSTWGPDASFTGSREYLQVLRRPYLDTPRPEFALDGVFSDGTHPFLYVVWSKLRTPGDVIDDGDRFQWVWELPRSQGVDLQLYLLESQPLGDPAVQQAYSDIVQCLTAINMGIGIGPVCDEPTPVAASLVSAVGEFDRALLTWAVDGGPSMIATIHRKAAERDWEVLGTRSPDGSGRIVFEDRNVEPGARYGYRLGLPASGGQQMVGEAWIEIPVTAKLALAGFRPNPAGRDVLVAFSLQTRERATLELFDLAGRRVIAREVGELGPGSHLVRLDESGRLHAGVYVVRLKQGGRAMTSKAAIVR